MLIRKSIVYAYHVLSLSLQGFVWPKYHSCLFLGPNMNIEIGVIIYMYLKHSPDSIDSKYIWVHCLTP